MRRHYTEQAKQDLGEFVERAGKSFLLIRCANIFGESQTIKVTPINLAEFYATQANNLSSGCRSLAGLTADWRPISELADACLRWFKQVNVERIRNAARKVGLTPRF